MALRVQPARYVSQFDPAAEQLTQNILRERSNRFEESFANLQQERARLGEMFFLDQEAKDRVLGDFEQRKQEVLDKYDNDFEAAAPELTKLVVNERANPIYQMNQLQQQKVAEFNQMRNKIGSGNAIIAKAPEMSLLDEAGNVRSPEDFEYQVFDRSQMMEKANQHLLPALNPRDLGLRRDPNNPMFYVQEIGVTRDQVNKALSDESVRTYMDDSPEIVALANSRGYTKPQEQLEFARQLLRTVAEKHQGVHDRRYKQDNLAVERYKRGLNNTSTPFGLLDINTKDMPAYINPFEEISEDPNFYGPNGEYSPELQATKVVEQLMPEFGIKDELRETATKKMGKALVSGSKKSLKAVVDQFMPEMGDFAVAALEKGWRVAHGKEIQVGESLKNFKKNHPEFKDLPNSEAAKAYNDLHRTYRAEFGKIHIPPNKYRVKQADNLFIDGDRIGNIANSVFSIYNEAGEKVSKATSNIGDIFEDTGLKSDDETAVGALGKIAYSGMTFTGDFPGALLGTGASNAGTVRLQVEPPDQIKEISFAPWAIAEALRSDGDDLGEIQKYGWAEKQKDGSIIVENSVPSLREKGIVGFKVKNQLTLNPETMRYDPVPKISMLNSRGQIVSVVGTGANGETIQTNYVPIDKVIQHTVASLEGLGYFEKQ